jgi:hypothetical protein
VTTTVKKVVVKRAAPVASADFSGPLVFEAGFERETPGTVKFKETGARENQVSGGIYIKKSALPEGVKVKRVRVTIEII